jgi:hypothetical protein
MEDLPARSHGCPSDLALEALWLRETAAVEAHGAHVAGCAACAHRIDWIRETDARFHAQVYPATVRAVTAAARPPARRRARLLWLSALPAAAALAMVVWTSPVPPPGYVGVKGDPVALEVFTEEAGTVRRLVDGDRIPAAAGLRFVARAPGRSVLLFTVDAAGKVSRLAPPPGAPAPAATGLLPGGARLDGVPGPERIFAVFLDGGTTPEDVERTARERFAGGDAARVRALGRLPIAMEQASLLLEKVELRP